MRNSKLAIVLALVVVALMVVPAFAASGSGSASGAPSSVTPGSTYDVTLTFTHDYTDAAGVQGTVAFDSSKVELLSDVSASNGGMGMVNPSTGAFTAAYAQTPASFTVTLKFKAKDGASGNPAISLSNYKFDVAGQDTNTATPSVSASATATATASTRPPLSNANTSTPTPTPTKTSSNVPATGDDNSMSMLFIGLAVVSMLGIGAVAAKRSFSK